MNIFASMQKMWANKVALFVSTCYITSKKLQGSDDFEENKMRDNFCFNSYAARAGGSSGTGVGRTRSYDPRRRR